MTGAYGTRTEHLQFCKERALEYVDIGDVQNAFASFASDMRKHPGTENHAALQLGTMMLAAGHWPSPAAMRRFIEGCN